MVDIAREPKYRFIGKIKIIATLSTLTVLVVIISVFSVNSSVLKKDDFRFGAVSSGDFEIDILGVGKIEPRDPTVIISPEGGKVDAVYIAPGEKTEEGQLLIKLENVDLQQELVSARAELISKQKTIKTEELVSKETLVNYQLKIQSAKNDFELAKTRFDAVSALSELAASPISKIEYEETRMRMNLARDIYVASEELLKTLGERQKARNEELDFELKQLETKVVQLESRVKKLEIRAPDVGTINNFDIKVGQYILPGSEVFQMVDLQDLYAKLKIPVESSVFVKQGMNVLVTVGRMNTKGIVSRMDPNTQGSTTSVDVEIDGSLEDIRMGMYVSGKILVDRDQDVMSVEIPYGVSAFSSSTIYILRNDDPSHVYATKIDFGRKASDRIEVLSGAKPGDLILLSNTNELKLKSEKIKLR